MSLWTDYSKVLTAVCNLGNFMQESIDILGLTHFTDPLVCVGICLSSNPTFSLFSGETYDSFIFIRGNLN